ncbi:Uncharacterised protein [Mycobacteroides abscessus subsp. abscessus]|nr:Uncharacterised protein [Mycobacteroides abscessus subsp. abscessus]
MTSSADSAQGSFTVTFDAQTSKRGQVARAVQLEARLLKKQASIAAYKRTIKRGRALNGESTSSVRTLSGGIPTLGQR